LGADGSVGDADFFSDMGTNNFSISEDISSTCSIISTSLC